MPQMTLEQVRDWHREQANLCRNSIAAYLGDKACGPIARKHDAMADAIDAHLTQPAHAVDVLPVRITKAPHYWEVGGGAKVDSATGYCNGWNDCLATCAESLTAAALPKDSNGAEGAAGWRPIETAPKDVKEVLVAFTSDGVRQVAEASWSDDEDVWVCSRDGFMLYRRNEPTHWMPLPDAPQEDTPDAAR